MAMQKFKMYITKSIRSWDEGRISINDFNMAETLSGREISHVLLGTQEIEIDVPEVDTRQTQIDALNEHIKIERARSHIQVNLLLERIGKLTCIANDVESE